MRRRRWGAKLGTSRKKAVMNARIYLGRAWIALTAALALGAAACGPENLDKAGGPVPKPVVILGVPMDIQ